MLQMQEDREQIEIYISCRSLTNKDTFSKSDPYVVMKAQNPQSGLWQEVGRTETIQNNLNPNFVKSLPYEYIFEIQQHVKFEVWDYDSPTKSDFIGECQTTIGVVAGSKNQTQIIELKDKSQKPGGKIILKLDKVNQCNDGLHLSMQIHNLVSQRWFAKPKPFVRFVRVSSQNQFRIQAHETEIVKYTNSPIFKPFEVRIQKLCNGNLDQNIILELWDYHKNGKHTFLGETVLTVNQLIVGK